MGIVLNVGVTTVKIQPRASAAVSIGLANLLMEVGKR